MLKVYTGDSEALKTISATYEFPENSVEPWEQLDWMKNKISEFQSSEEITIKTYSPYILNYLNLLLIKKELIPDNLKVFELIYDESIVHHVDLIIETSEGKPLVDTRSLTDPISYIYDEYNKIKEQNEQ